jgi:hypothetical protein
MANNNKSAEMDVGDGGVMRNGGGNFSRSLRRAASQAFWDGMEARFMERCKVSRFPNQQIALKNQSLVRQVHIAGCIAASNPFCREENLSLP